MLDAIVPRKELKGFLARAFRLLRAWDA
jgi:hypothetical protein